MGLTKPINNLASQAVELARSVAQSNPFAFSKTDINNLIEKIPDLKELGGLHSFSTRRASAAATPGQPATIQHKPKPITVPGQEPTINPAVDAKDVTPGFQQVGSTTAVLSALVAGIDDPAITKAFQFFAREQMALRQVPETVNV